MEQRFLKKSMHKTWTRLGSLVLVIVMILTMLPATALAAAPTELWVAGTQITGEGYWINDGSGGIKLEGADASNYNVHYDGNGTLTLKEAQITQGYSITVDEASIPMGIYCDGNLKLVLDGTNTVGNEAAQLLSGVLTTGNLEISGSGEVSVTVTKDLAYGIMAGTDLDIIGGTVTVTGTGTRSMGIMAAEGDVLISNSTVNSCLVDQEKMSYGILAAEGSVTIADSQVTAKGTLGGIMAESGMTIGGSSSVIAEGIGTNADTSVGSYGIYCNSGTVAITDTPNLTATGETSAIGFNTSGVFTVNGVKISVEDQSSIKVIDGVLEGSQPPADDGVNTEDELIAAIEQGGDIKLTGNIDLTKVLIIDNSVDLDLNGYTIRQSGSTTMNWCGWYSCPVDMCKWNCGDGAHSEKAISDAIHVVGGQSATVAVNIRDTSTAQPGKVIAGDSSDFAVTIYGDNLDLQIYGGTFSGGSGFCVYNSYRWSRSWITLYGGTYLNGVQVNSIINGTFQQKPQSNGDTFVCAYDIYNGICGIGTEAQMTEFYGGTFNGAAECFGIVEGGIFNGYLHLSGGVSSVSDCTINHSLEWSNSTMPTFTNVKFGENVKLWNDGYEIVNGQIQAIPKYTVLVTTADSDMGTVTVSGSVKNPGSAMGITPTTPANGGRQWADAYRNATVNITSATAEAKDGYKFVGWFDNADGTGTAISTNAMLTYQSDENGLQSDLSFYAVFESDASYGDKVATANIWLGDYDKTSEFTINSIGDMQSFTIAVNYLGKNFSGKTVKLADDLTYTDADSFTPIGNSGIAFQGIFDGQNHSISDLRYSTTNQSSAYVGLFGNVNGAEIKDLTLSGVNFSGGWMTGAFAGHADNTTFTNCKLTGNSSLADAYFLGGIFGHGAVSNTVSGCTVENSTIDGYWKTGGVAGYICGIEVENTKIEDTTFAGTSFTGALIGHANDGDTELTNVTVSGVTDGSQQKIHVVGTNYASGKDHTITITGSSTYVDAEGILQSSSGGNVTVSDGSYTFKVDGQIESENVSVTFQNGEEIVIVQVIEKGETVDLPTDPVKDGYTFQGWYSGDTKVTQETTFDESITVTAKWLGNSSGSSGTTYAVAVSESDNGAVTLSTSRASKGTKVTVTVKPDEGYVLETLTVTDGNGNAVELTKVSDTQYTFTMPGSAVTVKATFVDEGLPFTDVDGHWALEAIEYVYDAGMMTGTTATKFSPETELTRGMIVTILYRLENEPSVSGNDFADVNPSQYYADPIAWASANGIVTGYTDGTFGPENSITREQLAAILYRYASYKGYDVTGAADLSGYTDAENISTYAVDAMAWANAEGLITGVTSTTLNSTGTATRAQVATMLMRFCENIVQ